MPPAGVWFRDGWRLWGGGGDVKKIQRWWLVLISAYLTLQLEAALPSK